MFMSYVTAMCNFKPTERKSQKKDTFFSYDIHVLYIFFQKYMYYIFFSKIRNKYNSQKAQGAMLISYRTALYDFKTIEWKPWEKMHFTVTI